MREEIVARRRAERAVRRSTEIGETVADLLRHGAVTHELVAARTGVPLGYLLWAYPDSAALTASAAQRTSTPPLTCDDTTVKGA